ncbi:MAG: hypothetical protein QF681_16160, partial [Vicinamibacterales bacterium]|nr:hypothetical protein [Vicinamibacterales bacterium]
MVSRVSVACSVAAVSVAVTVGSLSARQVGGGDGGDLLSFDDSEQQAFDRRQYRWHSTDHDLPQAVGLAQHR